jgi:fructose PTS system EIIBC or EIIC component
MKIKDLLDPECICLNGTAKNKDDAINQLVALMAKSGKISDVEAYKKGVYAREKESTTAVGEGVAIPHCKGDCVNAPGLAAMTVTAGVDYDAPDGRKVTLLFLIAAPNTKDNIHVDVLSKLSVLLLDEEFSRKLVAAKSVNEFLSIIDAAEKAKDAEEKEEVSAAAGATVKLLAVTACPTGIAHTYMAEESLRKTAVAMGCSIKVETRGAGGTKNALTEKEIAEADCIIIAADTEVPLARFDGKPVIQCRVGEAISHTKDLIARASGGKVAIYHAGGDSAGEEAGGNAGHSIYRHLMTGVSHMIPFVVGGGILIAIAFLIDGFNIDLASLPVDQRSKFGTITPIAAFFKSTGGVAFGFMLPVLAGFIAMSIADRPGLALGFVGGAIAAAGKSGFLGALVAGFLAGYVIILLRKVFSKLPKGLDGIKPVLLYPLIGILVMGLGMYFVVEPFVGAINTWLNGALNNMNGTSNIVMGLILGGMMAVDMGGPVNKAAYVFGTAAITQGHYNIMASVMIGGMVPPIAIAAATILFKNKFTAEERKTGPVNFIMGLSFITEGAIPYAASDPVRVLPSCILGSAAAGAISMACNCTLMAPHGGIFVFPVVGNWPAYIGALFVGSAVGAGMLGLLKKKIA